MALVLAQIFENESHYFLVKLYLIKKVLTQPSDNCRHLSGIFGPLYVRVVGL